MTEKKSTPEKANAPAADPARQADADALRQASGQDNLGESGNQEDWRERYPEDDDEGQSQDASGGSSGSDNAARGGNTGNP